MEPAPGHKIRGCPEKPENAGKIRLLWFKEISKNCLTKGTPSVIIVKLAYGIPRKSEPANLENDTEKKRANIKERLAKIPKSEASKDVKD